MNIFPAQPGTYIVERDMTVSPPITIKVPVVGWIHIEGTMAFPVSVMSHGGLTHGKAIQHPEGFISDPSHGMVFSSLEEWEAFMRTAKPGWNQPKPMDEHADDYLDTMEQADAHEAELEEAEEEIDNSGQVGPIEFGDKVYKSRSFWKYPQAGAIFQIEGGEPYPRDGRVEKITRDEFTALKKDGHAVIDPTLGEVSEEDDDDAMDLV